MAARTFTANFIGRTDNLEKSFKRVSKGSSLMSDNLMRTTRMAGLGFAALGGVVIGAAAALKPMIDKAAAMEEALSKNKLLLGESSKAVDAFADTSLDRKSTRLNSSHRCTSYAVSCLKTKNTTEDKHL